MCAGMRGRQAGRQAHLSPCGVCISSLYLSPFLVPTNIFVDLIVVFWFAPVI